MSDTPQVPPVPLEDTQCCCGYEIHNGVLYEVRNAGCRIHGLRSRYWEPRRDRGEQ